MCASVLEHVNVLVYVVQLSCLPVLVTMFDTTHIRSVIPAEMRAYLQTLVPSTCTCAPSTSNTRRLVSARPLRPPDSLRISTMCTQACCPATSARWRYRSTANTSRSRSNCNCVTRASTTVCPSQVPATWPPSSFQTYLTLRSQTQTLHMPQRHRSPSTRRTALPNSISSVRRRRFFCPCVRARR